MSSFLFTNELGKPSARLSLSRLLFSFRCLELRAIARPVPRVSQVSNSSQMTYTHVSDTITYAPIKNPSALSRKIRRCKFAPAPKDATAPRSMSCTAARDWPGVPGERRADIRSSLRLVNKRSLPFFFFLSLAARVFVPRYPRPPVNSAWLTIF